MSSTSLTAPKRRINNDLNFAWAIYYKNDGGEYDLTGKTLTLWMKGTFEKVQITDFTVEGNIVTWTWKGTNQKHIGDYYAVLQDTTDGICRTVDIVNAVTLVPHTYQEDDGEQSTIDVSDVELSSEMAMALRGYSAYEIAVQNGYVGTEAQWLASLVGKQGESGNDGASMVIAQLFACLLRFILLGQI